MLHPPTVSLARSAASRLAAVAAVAATLVGCGRAGAFAELPDTASQTVKVYATECDQGDANACFAVGLAWWQADTNQQGLERDDARAARWMARACELDHVAACETVDRITAGQSPIGTAPTTEAPTPHGVHGTASEGSGTSTSE